MPTFNEEKQNKRLEELRQKEEEQLASILSQKYGLEYIDLSKVSIGMEALRLIPEAEARAAEVAAFRKLSKKLWVAVRSPNSDAAKAIIEKLKERDYQVAVFMVSRLSLERAWKRYEDLSFAVETKAGVLDISGEEIQKLLEKIKTLEDARGAVEEVMKLKRAFRVSRILETVLAGALARDASDIHIEPEEKNVRLRFRLDGVLTDILFFDLDTYQLLLSRIKLLSGLLLNVRDTAQDGRFSVAIDNKDTEIRTSILPGAYGEAIVLRILRPDTIAVPMEQLGIEPKLLEILEREIRKPNGMILTTGPTGAGKTTTLYAFLRKIHTPDIKIITIEDPIEYHLPGIVQTQVEKTKYTFSQGLRSALRQDPDVIMVGEIRDGEVAETAINSALTGHLVFSTLHTNSAAGAFPRLLDLGINPKVVGSAISIVMAQRLVRRLRQDCAKEVKLEGKRKEFVDRVLDSIVDKSLVPKNTSVVWQAVESKECESGYKGRVGVFEAIRVDEAITALVREGEGDREIGQAALKQGLLNLEQDGVIKALTGVTTIEELERVLDIKER